MRPLVLIKNLIVMITKIIKPSNIFNTVVYYIWGENTKFFENRYIGDNEDKSGKVYYRACDEKANTLDFAEYGFNFKPIKYKFDNSLNLNYLQSDIIELADKKISELKKLENYPFYTISKSSDNKELEYGLFGSIKVDEGNLYLLDVPENCYRIELYSETISYNSRKISENSYNFINYDRIKVYESEYDNITVPNAIITFGPSPEHYLNPDSMYYNNNTSLRSKTKPWTTTEEKEAVVKEYRRLRDEINSKKIVWFLTVTDEPTNTKVNVSYYSWTANNNPLRNRNKYSIRNDEYESFKNYPRLLYQEDKYVFSRVTNVNLGIPSDIDSGFPIFNIKKDLKDNIYSKYITYKKGDKVDYCGDTYISLVNNNRENTPNVSSSWMLFDTFEGYFTKNIYFMSDYVGAITFDPPYTTIPKNQKASIKIKATEHTGFTIDNDNLVAYFKNGETHTLTQDEYTYSSNTKEKIFTIKDWTNISEADRIVFGTNAEAVTIDFKVLFEGVEYPIEEFETKSGLIHTVIRDRVHNKYINNYRDSKIDIKDLIQFMDLDNKPIDKSSILNLEKDEEKRIRYKVNIDKIFNDSVNYILKSFKVVHKLPQGDKVIDFGTDTIITDVVDATKIIYMLEIESVKKQIKFEFDTRVFEISKPTQIVNYGSNRNESLIYRIKDPVINDYRGKLKTLTVYGKLEKLVNGEIVYEEVSSVIPMPSDMTIYSYYFGYELDNIDRPIAITIKRLEERNGYNIVPEEQWLSVNINTTSDIIIKLEYQ